MYDNSYHESLVMSPAQVNKENIATVYNKLCSQPEKKVRPYLPEGDTVLRRLDKPLFTKGYSQTFDNEPVTVYKVRTTIPPTYMLEGTDGKIARAYYEKELLKL